MNINLHIERVVLDEVSIEPHHRPLLKAALEAELGKLLGQHGIAAGLQNGTSLKTLHATPIVVGENNEPVRLGEEIAHSVYGELNR